MRPGILTFSGILAAVLILPACTDRSGQIEMMPTRADGAAFFSQNCASCHGADGRGADLADSGLTRAPTDLTRLSAKNGGAFPAAQSLSYIYGDPRNSHLSRVMPEFGEDIAQDLVPVEIEGVLTPTPRELAGLLFYLESIQKK